MGESEMECIRELQEMVSDLTKRIGDLRNRVEFLEREVYGKAMG